jgi:hypothetical protein
MDVTHLYSKRVDRNPQFFSKLTSGPNSFLFIVRVIPEDQAPLFPRCELIETLFKASGSSLKLDGIWIWRWIGSRLRFWFEENLFGNAVDIESRVPYIILEQPIDFARSHIERLIREILRVATTFGRKDPDYPKLDRLVLLRGLVAIRIKPLQ